MSTYVEELSNRIFNLNDELTALQNDFDRVCKRLREQDQDITDLQNENGVYANENAILRRQLDKIRDLVI